MSAREGAVSITSGDGRRWEFLDIVDGPNAGESWYAYLLRRRYEKEQILGHFEPPSRWQVVFRFSYDMAKALAGDNAAAQRIFPYVQPDDWQGWFPTRLFGCRCFRESYPGALFRDYQGFDGMTPNPEDERARQQRISGN